jgi:hypothetical protein
MDPYLEAHGLWPDVHNSIIFVAREFLIQQLRPKYYVRIEERVYISDEDDPGRDVIIPDLRVGEPEEGLGQGAAPVPGTELQVAEPIVITTLLDDEIHESRLEVLDSVNRSVIAVIEVVSPTNKVAGSRGRESYRAKRAEILASPSHWVEIDLLRTGTSWIPRQMLSRGDYFVYLSRAAERRKAFVWPILLPQRLPVIPIPLKGGDADAKLDLQGVLDTVYDRSGYDMLIDYRKPPEIPLSDEDAAWADQLLRDKGLR